MLGRWQRRWVAAASDKGWPTTGSLARVRRTQIRRWDEGFVCPGDQSRCTVETACICQRPAGTVKHNSTHRKNLQRYHSPLFYQNARQRRTLRHYFLGYGATICLSLVFSRIVGRLSLDVVLVLLSFGAAGRWAYARRSDGAADFGLAGATNAVIPKRIWRGRVGEQRSKCRQPLSGRAATSGRATASMPKVMTALAILHKSRELGRAGPSITITPPTLPCISRILAEPIGVRVGGETLTNISVAGHAHSVGTNIADIMHVAFAR